MLGRLSPLALSAYLHRYANSGTQDGSFVTSHKLDLREAFRLGGVANLIPPEKPNIGAKFIFSLERPMPGEIIPLGPPAAPGG